MCICLVDKIPSKYLCRAVTITHYALKHAWLKVTEQMLVEPDLRASLGQTTQPSPLWRPPPRREKSEKPVKPQILKSCFVRSKYTENLKCFLGGKGKPKGSWKYFMLTWMENLGKATDFPQPKPFPTTSSREQMSFNFLDAVTVRCDFGAQENKVCHSFHFNPR